MTQSLYRKDNEYFAVYFSLWCTQCISSCIFNKTQVLRPFSYRIKSVYCRTSICKDYQVIPPLCLTERRKTTRQEMVVICNSGVLRWGDLAHSSDSRKHGILYFPCFMLVHIPSNAHFSTPFFKKIVFFSKICFGSPPSKFLEVCLNSEYMWKWSQVYNFNSARALKKLLSATLPNSDTLQDLLI